MDQYGRRVNEDAGEPRLPMLDVVESALAAAWSTRVTLVSPERLWGRENVLRFEVDAHGVSGVPASVVLKRPTDERSERGFAPERAALTVLGSDDRSVSPQLFAAADDPQFVVMEDLAGGPSLADLLLARDRDAATRGLLLYAEALADLHVAGLTARDQFEARLRAHHRDPREAQWMQRPSSSDLTSQLEALGVTATGVEADLAVIDRALSQPGDFDSIVHGDPCPDNCRITEGRLRLFDFEITFVGHMLIDALYLVVPFPTCWCVAALPEDVAGHALDTYRARIADVVPAATDDRVWAREVRLIWAAWITSAVFRTLARARSGEEAWGTSTRRERVVTRLASFVAHAPSSDPLPAFTACAEQVLAALRKHWAPDEPALPAYPALAGPGERVATPPDHWFPGA